MKEKLKKALYSPVLRNCLCTCMAFTWWVYHSRVSLLLFGELPYPEENDY